MSKELELKVEAVLEEIQRTIEEKLVPLVDSEEFCRTQEDNLWYKAMLELLGAFAAVASGNNLGLALVAINASEGPEPNHVATMMAKDPKTTKGLSMLLLKMIATQGETNVH